MSLRQIVETGKTEAGFKIIGTMIMLALQGILLYAAISQKVDEMARDSRRILRSENTEHRRLWQAVGKPEMFNYIEPMEPSDNQLHKITP